MINLIEIGTKNDILDNKVKIIHSQWIDNFSLKDWENGNKTYKLHHIRDEEAATFESRSITLLEMRGKDIIRQWEEEILVKNNTLFMISPIQEGENEDDEE